MQWISRGFGLVIAVWLLSGCGPQGEQIMIQHARGADYATGYGDGCQSGRKAAGSTEAVAKKETQSYLNSAQYREGWNTGYEECKFREEKVAKLSRRSGRLSE